MKITDTIKTLRLHEDWRKGEGEQLNPRLISQAIDAAIAQLSEHRAMSLRINQLEADIRLVIDNMETGFTVCERCSNEQPVKDMDYKWMLEEALKGGDQ